MRLNVGPFQVSAASCVREFDRTVAFFYRETEPGGDAQDPIFDYRIAMHRPAGFRRWLRPQVEFTIDGLRPFLPHPVENAFPMFEWGLNWCIATSAHRYMMLHAGTVAFGDRALILPGMPGSGKSTLTAALHLHGARLLSDEFGLVRPEHVDLLPMPRPIPLKNASIEAIRAFEPDTPLGPTYPKTRKGRVCHVRAADDSQRRQHEPARPRWLVFPRYSEGAAECLQPLNKTEAFRQLAFNCFNYRLLGEVSFRTVGEMIRAADCYTFEFSRLDRAAEILAALADD